MKSASAATAAAIKLSRQAGAKVCSEIGFGVSLSGLARVVQFADKDLLRFIMNVTASDEGQDSFRSHMEKLAYIHQR